jgi:hypothetical protein
MQKIAQLISILEPKHADQLIYLDRLLKVYSRFLTSWKPAELKSNGKVMTIRFFSVNKYGYKHTTSGEFDIADIHKHISLYKEKIREEFSKRNQNLRVIRDKETIKWSKYIKDAEV